MRYWFWVLLDSLSKLHLILKSGQRNAALERMVRNYFIHFNVFKCSLWDFLLFVKWYTDLWNKGRLGCTISFQNSPKHQKALHCMQYESSTLYSKALFSNSLICTLKLCFESRLKDKLSFIHVYWNLLTK